MTKKQKHQTQKYLRVAFDSVTSYEQAKEIYLLSIALDLDQDFRTELFMDMEEM